MRTATIPSTRAAPFAFHAESTVTIDNVLPAALFEHLDDPRRLGGHMEKPSWRTLGSSMHYSMAEDARRHFS